MGEEATTVVRLEALFCFFFFRRESAWFACTWAK